MANMLATFGQFERRLISQRTKKAQAVKKAEGVMLGRPPTMPQAVVRRIQRQRARGDSLRKIADDLNVAGVPTAQGGAAWYAATVRHVLLRRRSPSRPGSCPPPARSSARGACGRGVGLPSRVRARAASGALHRLAERRCPGLSASWGGVERPPGGAALTPRLD